MRQIRIVIADDHHVVRQGIKALLELDPEFCIVAEASDGLEAIEKAKELQPDVLLLDIVMPGLNGLEVARQIKRTNPEIKIVILSMHANEAYVIEAFRNGALSYVLKNSEYLEMARAIRYAQVGQRYLSPPLSNMAIDAYIEKASPAIAGSYQSLTARERVVLQLAADGLSNAHIAEKLSISPRTVEVHRANLMRKLSLHNQAELVKYALTNGLISVNS